MYRYEYVNHKLNMIFMRRNKWTWSKYMNMNMNTICTYIYKYLYVHKCKCVIMYINEYASILKIKYVMYIRMQIRMYVYVETCVFPFYATIHPGNCVRGHYPQEHFAKTNDKACDWQTNSYPAGNWHIRSKGSWEDEIPVPSWDMLVSWRVMLASFPM